MFVTNFLQKITSKNNNLENKNLLENNNLENKNLENKNLLENNNSIIKLDFQENNDLSVKLESLQKNKSIAKNCNDDTYINKIIDLYVDKFNSKNTDKIDEIIDDFYIDYKNLNGKNDSYEKYKKILLIKLKNKYKNKNILVCIYKTTNNTINLFEVNNINYSINQNQDILYLIQYIWLKNNIYP